MGESVFIEPKNKRILALEELRKPKSKRNLQVFAGMVASIQNWFPSLPLVILNIRRACGGQGHTGVGCDDGAGVWDGEGSYEN